MGELPRLHMDATDVHVIDKESNRLAQMMADETNGTVGARAVAGGHDLGRTGTRERLSPLMSEHIADLMAATCLSRSTLYRVTSEPRPETLQALEEGMRLLDRENPQGMAGWREIPTEWLTGRLRVSDVEFAALRPGKRTCSAEERARLQAALADWRAKQSA